MSNALPTIQWDHSTSTPILGQGTWQMGDSKRKRTKEIESLQLGIELGMTLIDTAEMYGEGKSEALVGEAIKPYRREDLFLVSKVYPWHAGKKQMETSCRESLERLKTDYLDLYLLHWRGAIPLAETIDSFERLKEKGFIRRWGVSNFDLDDIKQLLKIDGGDSVATVQNLYHLGSRGVEFELLPWLQEKQIPFMAYCPLAQAGALKSSLIKNEDVLAIAEKFEVTPFQILLAFALQRPGVIAIPKASTPTHVEQNRRAANIRLTESDLAILDRAFPPPHRKVPLDVE